MQFSSWAICSLLLAALLAQVCSVQIQDVITASGDVIRVAKKLQACPWESGTTTAINTVLCSDGVSVTDWKCAIGGHGQRVKCPPNLPKMCATLACGGNKDHCCEADCSGKGGERPCLPKEATCLTSGSAGIGAGKTCNFPFKYKGVSYHECTTYGNRGNRGRMVLPWCYVTVDQNGVGVEGKWGHCSETCKAPHMDFGGSKHGVDSVGDNMRPELVKTQVCEESLSTCSECTRQGSCWRGITSGKLKLDVSASAKAKYYAAEVWASCAGGNGKWYVYVASAKALNGVGGLVNGVLKIFVDGSLHKTVHVSDAVHGWRDDVPIAKNTHVRILFERSLAGQAASGYISLYGTNVDEYVDDCMGVKDCLVSLGDGSDSAFRFRNSNGKQLACLVASSTAERDAVSDHCNVWDTCLSSSGTKSKVKALLGAGLTPRGSLAEGETNIQKFSDAEDCVDPSVEDPEAWDCECMDAMTASCHGVNEECFNQILCKNTNVCESWKGAHCAALLLAKQNISIKAPQTKSAALMSRGTQRASATVEDRLDSALSGKCSQ